jgi:hypothetical protein
VVHGPNKERERIKYNRVENKGTCKEGETEDIGKQKNIPFRETINRLKEE